MKCLRCGGLTRKRRVKLLQQWGEEFYVFRNVPAHVCQECSEEYYDAEVLKRVDELREIADQAAERIEIPAIDYFEREKAA